MSAKAGIHRVAENPVQLQRLGSLTSPSISLPIMSVSLAPTLNPAPMPSDVASDSPSGLNHIAPVRSGAAAPGWFLEKSSAAWGEFVKLPVPSIKDESWRYSNAKKISLAELHPAAAANEHLEAEAVAASDGLSGAVGRFIFVNDRLVLSETVQLPEGVVCLPLEEALQSHGKWLEEHFMKRESFLGSAKFAALHLAHVKAGLVVYVPDNIELKSPIEVFHWIKGANAAIFPHTLVITGANAKVTVVDHYRSDDGSLAFSCAVSDVIAGIGSEITYVACQELGTLGQAMHLSSTTTQKDAKVKSFQAQIGAAFSRTESVSNLVGAGSRSDMLSISLPVADQVVDQRTLQRHLAPHTYSDLLYKNALYDRSRAIFSGLIHVFEGAHYTDAYQTCRNLLNSEEAEASSMPGLEINADQVKCSHGSTSSPVSEEELFYLKARGIPDAEARRLIVLGFLQKPVSRLENDVIEAMIARRLDEKFSRVAGQLVA